MPLHADTPTLLWPSSTRFPFADVPEWVENALCSSFPQVRVIVARSEEVFQQELPVCEILVTWKITPEQLARCHRLRWIHSPATGLEQLLIPQLIESDVLVSNGRSVHAIPVAEQALALILALARRLPHCFRFQAQARWGRSEGWQPGQVPSEITGTTLGLVGLGTIGREIAQRAGALGMKIIAVKRDSARGAELVSKLYPPRQLKDMLAEADFVVVAAPETPETRHLIGSAELAAMKLAAFLINVARGSLVDTSALTEALVTGRIAGAGLDVTDPEPLPPEHPLWSLSNVLITPHLGGATDRFWPQQADLLATNLRRYLSGQPLLNLVDKSRGY
jgi:phosphoglycerate dehydrogenase-like enzyme